MPPSHLDPRPMLRRAGNRTCPMIHGHSGIRRVRCSCVRSTRCRDSFMGMPVRPGMRALGRGAAVSLGLRPECFDAFVDSVLRVAPTYPKLAIRTSPARMTGWRCLLVPRTFSPIERRANRETRWVRFEPTPNALTGVNKGNTTSQPRRASEAASHPASNREIRARNSAPRKM
jgi:hypothetical protein